MISIGMISFLNNKGYLESNSRNNEHFIPELIKRELFSIHPGNDFDPRKRHFSPEELRPHPMIKKSRKV
jgi:hypothetical protein